MNTLKRIGAAVVLSCILTGTAAPIAAATQGRAEHSAVTQVASDAVFTSVTFNKNEATNGEEVIAILPLSLNDDARKGDTATVFLPSELSPKGIQPFDVVSPEGEIVGTAAWTNENRAITVKFADYVENHENTVGTIRIATQWSESVYSDQPVSYSLTFTTDTGGSFSALLAYRPPVTGTPVDVDSREQHHSMSWTSPLEGGLDGANAVVAFSALPASPAGFKNGLTATITMRPDARFDCDPIGMPGVQVLSSTAKQPYGPMDPARFVVTCTASEVVVDFGVVNGGEFIDVQVPGSVTDVSKKTYYSDLVVTGSGFFGTDDAFVQRSSGDGQGEGYQGVSIGDTVFNDLNANGVQEPGEPGLPDVLLTLTRTDGLPATTLDGLPANRISTGADGFYGFFNFPALSAGSYVVTWTPDPGYDGLEGFRPTTPSARETSPAAREADNTVDFGFTSTTPPVTPTPEPTPPTIPTPTPQPPTEPTPAPEPPVTPEPTPAPAPEPTPAPEPPVAPMPTPEPSVTTQPPAASNPPTPEPAPDAAELPVEPSTNPAPPVAPEPAPEVGEVPQPEALAETGFLSTTVWSLLAAVSALGLFASIQAQRIRRREQK